MFVFFLIELDVETTTVVDGKRAETIGGTTIDGGGGSLVLLLGRGVVDVAAVRRCIGFGVGLF